LYHSEKPGTSDQFEKIHKYCKILIAYDIRPCYRQADSFRRGNMYQEELRIAHLVLSILCGLYTAILAVLVFKGAPKARKNPEAFDQSWLNVAILMINLWGFLLLVLPQMLTGGGKSMPIILMIISAFACMGIHGWVRTIVVREKDHPFTAIAVASAILLVLSNTVLITIY
jgi:H+/Cl- antiporter ClcA